jgi:dCMP deaminase
MRPSWDDTWMQVAHVIAKRSRCVRSQAGVVIVGPDQRIVSTGYNGPPRSYRIDTMDFYGMGRRVMTEQTTCAEFCPRAKTGGSLSYDDCVSSHSEANALMYSERLAREGGTLYSTRVPCFMCAKMTANSGLARVVYCIAFEDKDRQPERTKELLDACGLQVIVIAG